MTPQEAINNIDDVLSSDVNYDESMDYQLTSYDIDWLEKAKESLEKQIPKKLIKKNPLAYEKAKNGEEKLVYKHYCPNCNERIKTIEHHCVCGQTLDWSD